MAESKVKPENFITIQGWMLLDLCLKGNELLIYAIIYGFSQVEGHLFNGGLKYLAEWTNSTKQGVMKALKSLEEKNLIARKEEVWNGIKKVEYYATKFNGVVNKVEQGGKQSLMGGIQQSLPDIIDTNNKEQKDSNNKDIQSTKKPTRFERPTVEQVQAYCKERNNGIDAQYFIDYYESRGWKLKGGNPIVDWQACVRTWEKNNYGGGSGKGSKTVTTDDDPYAELRRLTTV